MSDKNVVKIFQYKNKLIFWALIEVLMAILSYNLYLSNSNTISVACVVVVILPILYPLLSKNALAIAYFDENGVTVKKFGKQLATHLWQDSEVGVYKKRIGTKYSYYIYISRPQPVLEHKDPKHILNFTLNDECVLAFVTYYTGEYKGYEILEDRHVEVFERAKRAISTVRDRQIDRDKSDARRRTEEEKGRARERKNKKK